MDSQQFRRCLGAHRVRDLCAPIAALRGVARVSEARHELDPGIRDPNRPPPRLRGLPRVPIARDRRNDDVERVGGVAAVCRRIGKRADDVQHLDDRTRPAVRDDQRQRVLVRRLDVDEVDVETVDLRDELRQRIQPGLEPAQVVLSAPVANELLHRRQLHAL